MKAKTIRLFWDKNDLKRFGLQLNQIEPSELDPEINAYLAGMERLEIAREQVVIYTFDLENHAHVKVIEDINTAINNPNDYTGAVKVDKDGNYNGFTLVIMNE